ncbi:MAG TPA: hypothetical protein VK166_00600 [Chitinophagaceae bacterium]|nr:hypothetical protein [Chitinophagaceae bacterium]
MNKFLIILFVLCAQFSLAQKQAIVKSQRIFGKVSKVEITNVLFTLNSKNEVEQNPGTDTDIFYFDENQNLVRQQLVVDYSKLDPTGKTKPKTSEITVTPVKEAEKPVSRTPAGALGDDAWIYHYTDGTRMMVVKQAEHPFHIFLGYIDKDDNIYFKKEFNKDSVLRTEIRFRKENPKDTFSVRIFDERGNLFMSIPFEKGVKQHPDQMYKYQYDKYANPTMVMQSNWNAAGKAWQPKYGYLCKYTYMKDQAGAVTAPAPARDGKDEMAEAGGSKSESGSSSGSPETKEKKSLKDKLNPFKKKD